MEWSPSDLKRLQSNQKVFSNWAKSFQARPKAIYAPTTEFQLRQLVSYARTNHLELRAFGSGHSPSDLVCTDGILVSLDKMNKVLQVDLEANTMTVQAGIRLHTLIEEAARHRLALSNLGSITDQSLAGVVSTSTHGTGLRHGTLSTHILEATLVLADSSVVACSKEENPDLFYASLCGLGCTGIFTKFKIQLQPLYHLVEEHFTMSFDDFIGYLDQGDGSQTIWGSAEHVRAYWVPHLAKVKISRLDHVPLDLPLRPACFTLYERWVSHWLFGTHIHQLALLASRFVPTLLSSYASFNWRFAFSGQPHPFLSLFKPVPKQPHPEFPTSDNYRAFVDRYDRLFTFDCGPRQYTFECAVPIARLKETLEVLREWMDGEAAKKHGLRHHFPLEIRPVEADDIWLSPAYQQRVVYIGVCQYKPYGFDTPWQEFFERFEEICLAHGARPHWAKAHHASPADLASMYPRFNDFQRVRQQVDPEGVFLNPYTKRHLKGRIGARYDYMRFYSGSNLG